MSATSCRCGTTWTGLRIEHCPECHETFTGTTSGDRHRTGDHAISVGPNRRRCRNNRGDARSRHGQERPGPVDQRRNVAVGHGCRARSVRMIRHALTALACLTIATCLIAAVLSASGVAS